ncbi:DNA polymerase III subunit gamma/tau [Candidatus Uabimicrobium amorphum]|uniref:DNA polymerase III subunit gamma/tau n=1 Tax=Uabimicrobium amorphum TaxID=2596890 RepID=A0A5S9IKL6_UABAM|nr:DNA polymerase III subunit gamma/tau [Candidatus Uabimicrobium amorphum]BBM83092.1 DNA polymerase III subunit gamma/tau [Candidatus Uabimicrobium amorphum]
MDYLAFSRKYRPQNFDEVIGQQHIATTLKNAIINNRVHHAYLFCGSRGVGKTSTARIFAKALNCPEAKEGISCNKCVVCQRIAIGEDMDVLEVDGASNRGIEEIRNIKNDVKYLPSQGKYKIFIIDEVHMLTQAAFNALLKTLEEPPTHVKFIFATTQVYSIPDTILSRCQRFDFRKIKIEDVVTRLKQVAKKEKIKISEDALLQIAQIAKGALRDSLVLLDQVYSYSGDSIDIKDLEKILGNDSEYIFTTLQALADKNVEDLLEVVEKFSEEGGDFSNFIDQLAQQLRDLLVFSMSGDKFISGTDFYIEQLKKLQNKFSHDYIFQAMQHIITSKVHFQRGLLGRILLETLLLKIMNIESLLPLEEMIEHLTALEKKNSSFPQSPALSQQPQPQLPPKAKPKEKSALDFFQQPRNQKKNDITNSLQTFSPAKTSNVARQTNKTPEVAVTEAKTPKQLFLSLLEEKKLGRNMISVLRDDAQITINNKVLLIKIDHKITMDMLKNKKNYPIVIEAVKQAYGSEVQARLVYEGENQPRKNQEKHKAIVENDPIVSLCMELFSARVIKIDAIHKKQQ